MTALRGIVLDSLIDDLEVEDGVAAGFGARLERWNDDPAALEYADFVLHVRTRVDRALLQRLRRGAVVARYGTGLDTVDLAAAKERGIAVVGVRDYATEEVAQHAVGLALAAARRLGASQATHGGAAWNEISGSPYGVSGPVGIVGLGTIGRATAQLFLGLGREVMASSRREASASDLPSVPIVSLDSLLAACEVVSLHVALTSETERLLDDRRLRLMRPDAILVNTARAGLIDGPALLDALRHGRLRGAGLDAFEGTEGSVLWEALDAEPLNVVRTPHVAWYSPRSLERLRREVVEAAIAAVRERTVAA